MNDGWVRGGGGPPESGRPDKGPETPGQGAAGQATRRRRQRADAQQSIAAILEAATDVLNVDVGASIEDIARAAGVTRQTVYAHFSSRQALLNAVIERAVVTVTAAFDAAGEEEAPPAVALTRLLNTGMRAAARYAFLWQLPEVSAEEDRDRHQPVMERMLAIIERGQETGDIDATLSPSWLLTAALALGRAAEGEVKAGRMTAAEAGDAVRDSCLRLFGITDPT